MNKKLFFQIISLIFVVLILSFTFYKIDWNILIKSFKNINYYYFIILIIGSLLLNILKAFRLKKILNSDLSFDIFFAIFLIYTFVSVILPIKLGEFVFPYLYKKYTNTDFIKSLSLVILVRVFDLFVILLLSSLSVFFYLDNIQLKFALVLSILLCIFIFISLKSSIFIKKISKIFNFLKLPKQFSESIQEISQFSNKIILKLFFHSLIIWILAYIIGYFMILTTGNNINFLGALIWNSLVSLASAIPINTPAMLGYIQASSLVVFNNFGNSVKNPLEISLIINSFILLFNLVWFLLSVLYLFIKNKVVAVSQF